MSCYQFAMVHTLLEISKQGLRVVNWSFFNRNRSILQGNIYQLSNWCHQLQYTKRWTYYTIYLLHEPTINKNQWSKFYQKNKKTTFGKQHSIKTYKSRKYRLHCLVNKTNTYNHLCNYQVNMQEVSRISIQRRRNKLLFFN